MGTTIRDMTLNNDSNKFIRLNPLYHNIEQYTDPSSNYIYPENSLRNYVNLTGDINNNDVYVNGLTYHIENSINDYISNAKINFLDLSLNHDLHSLLLWGENKLDKFPTTVY